MKKDMDAARYLRDVLKAIEGVHVTEHKDDCHYSSFRVEGKENTWSRSARRKRKRRQEAREGAEVGITENIVALKDSTPELVCDVRIFQPKRETLAWNDPKIDLHADIHPRNETNAEDTEWTGLEVGEDAEGNGSCGAEHLNLQEPEVPGYYLECQWIFGTDQRVFETFAGHIGRKLIECINAG